MSDHEVSRGLTPLEDTIEFLRIRALDHERTADYYSRHGLDRAAEHTYEVADHLREAAYLLERAHEPQDGESAEAAAPDDQEPLAPWEKALLDSSVLPIAVGFYWDREGSLWHLNGEGSWSDFSREGQRTVHKPGMEPRAYGPFTEAHL